jgi:hypothetical protein
MDASPEVRRATALANSGSPYRPGGRGLLRAGDIGARWPMEGDWTAP